jgi:hypothetical protein
MKLGQTESKTERKYERQIAGKKRVTKDQEHSAKKKAYVRHSRLLIN